MPEPGCLALGVPAGAPGDRLGHGVPGALAVKILDRLANPHAVEAGGVGRVALAQHRGDFLD